MTTGQGWLDTNENRRFPLDDNADVGGLPDDVIADLKVVVPAEVLAAAGNALPRLVSVSCGPSYISAVVAIGDKEIAWFGGDLEPHVPLPLEPLASGAGGFIVFGQGIRTWRGVAVLPNGVLAAPAVSVAFDTGVGAIAFESDGSTTELTDLIQIDRAADIAVTHRGTVSGYPNVIEFSVPDTIDPLLNEQLLGNCGKNVQGKTCAPTPIGAVNGVRPDKNGKLIIRIVNNTTSPLTLGGNGTPKAEINTALSLTRACEDRLDVVGEPDVSGGLVKKC